ncbi:replication-relaxation family protein [Oceanobacillus kimchii]|uniref:replication-relaxation family protein n=1 Tax=Oceanobacillus kimchii TaxID=746691 RepID=UPI003B02D53E
MIKQLFKMKIQRSFIKLRNQKKRFGVSPKGVHLALFELKILNELAELKILNTNQLQFLHQKYQSIKEDTLRKKLNRWHNREIIHKIDVGKRKNFGNDMNLYRIDRNGISILVQEWFISENQHIDIKNFDNIKNIDHFLGTNQNILGIKMELEVEGFTVEYANHLIKLTKDFGIISDAILMINDVIIYIETDMGTESLAELNNKLYRYANLARTYKNYKHIVAISFLDNTYITRKYYEIKGDRRKANIKKLNIYNDDIFVPNLKITLSDFNKTPNIITSTILNSSERSMLTHLNEFARLFQEKEKFILIQIDDAEVYSKQVLDTHRGLNVFCEVYNGAGNFVERIAMLIMDKNDLHHNIIMNNLINYVSDNVFLKYINRLIVIYPTKEDREQDIYGISYLSNILFTDLETMREDKEDRYYISKSAYNMKRVPYII